MFESFFFFSCKKEKNVFDKNFKLFLKIKRFTCKNSMKVPSLFFFFCLYSEYVIKNYLEECLYFWE